jgi:hypothetical protein
MAICRCADIYSGENGAFECLDWIGLRSPISLFQALIAAGVLVTLSGVC